MQSSARIERILPDACHRPRDCHSREVGAVAEGTVPDGRHRVVRAVVGHR